MITLLMIANPLSLLLPLLLSGALCIVVGFWVCYRAGYDKGIEDEREITRIHNLPQMRERDSMNPVHIRL